MQVGIIRVDGCGEAGLQTVPILQVKRTGETRDCFLNVVYIVYVLPRKKSLHIRRKRRLPRRRHPAFRDHLAGAILVRVGPIRFRLAR